MEILPQVIMIVWIAYSIGWNTAKHGETRFISAYNAITVICILVSLLFWGGFFNPLLR